MAKIEKFEDLQVWQLGREICKDIWALFEATSLGHDYELKNQTSRSSGSIMDNIAEGFERDGNLEFRQFLSIAKGSAGETRYQLYRVFDFEYISEQKFEVLKTDYENLSGKIKNFITYLNKKDFKGNKFQ